MSYREVFRKYAMEHGFNSKIFIDSSTFVHIANIAGCFSDSDMFAVYETDEKGDAKNIKYHCSDFLAYCDLAERFGYNFRPFM